MKTAVIIQARMGSTRLPGKVMMQLGDSTVLGQVVSRIQGIPSVDAVVVATTTEPTDIPLAGAAAALGAKVVRGSLEDVLDRYYQAANACAADVIVRVTSDCPLIDPEVVGEAIARFKGGVGLDYLSNTLERTYPRGLDVEVFSATALRRAHAEAIKPYEREHVTPYFYQHGELFKLASIRNPAGDHSDHRWTLDTQEDYRFLQAVFTELAHLPQIRTADVLALLTRQPDLATINATVEQKHLGG